MLETLKIFFIIIIILMIMQILIELDLLGDKLYKYITQ